MAMGAARDETEADLLLTRVRGDKTGPNERIQIRVGTECPPVDYRLTHRVLSSHTGDVGLANGRLSTCRWCDLRAVRLSIDADCVANVEP
jgi:hypothetical protein